MSQQSWSDGKKWWMDLLKSAVAFACVSAVTILVLWRWDDARLQANHKWQAEHSLKIGAIQEFSRAARLYGLWSHDATKERMCGAKRTKDNVIGKWEDDGFDNVAIARLSVKAAFPGVDLGTLWAAFNAAQREIHAQYKQVRTAVSSRECKRGEEHLASVWKAYNDAHLKPARDKYDCATDAVISELLKKLGAPGTPTDEKCKRLTTRSNGPALAMLAPAAERER